MDQREAIKLFADKKEKKFNSSLFMYRNRTDLWVLILYPATLLNSFITSNSILVESLGLLIYKILLPENRDNFKGKERSS